MLICVFPFRKSYYALIGQLNRSVPVASDEASTAIDVTLRTWTPVQTDSFLNPAPILQLKADNYPLVRFWTEKKWHVWKGTDNGEASTSKHSFLEDDLGQPLPEARVTSILSNMRDIWHKFRRRNLIDANITWTSMSLVVKKTFRAEIIKSFPELNLCEDMWKVDQLAKRHYASYKQTWFTNKSDEKSTSAGKRKMKVESDSNNMIDSRDIDTAKRSAKRVKTGERMTTTLGYTGDDHSSLIALSDTDSAPSSSSSVALPTAPVINTNPTLPTTTAPLPEDTPSPESPPSIPSPLSANVSLYVETCTRSDVLCPDDSSASMSTPPMDTKTSEPHQANGTTKLVVQVKNPL